MKKIILSLIFVLITTLTTSCSKNDVNQLSSIKEKGKISLAVSPDYPPYEFYIAENGKVKITGADIYLAEEVAKNMGVELEIVELSFDSLLPALTSGRVDMVISGMNPSPERTKVVDFSDIYYTSGSKFIIRKNDTDFNKIEEIYDKKIGVQKGSIQEKYLIDELKISEKNIQSLSDVPNVLQDLENGNVDLVFLSEDVSAISLNKKTELKLSNLKLEKDAESEGMAIAFRKGNNSDLLAEVNKVINNISKEEVFETKLKEYAKLVNEQ